MTEELAYSRIVLKLSGDLFKGEAGPVDPDKIGLLGQALVNISKTGAEVAVVTGGGNFLRGRDFKNAKIDRVQIDYAGMLATVINALLLQQALNQLGVESRVMSSLEVNKACEPYIRLKAISHLKNVRIVLLPGGMGSPLFSTDTAAAHKAVEIGAKLLAKATSVDGVYDKDPKKDRNAKKFERVTYAEAINRRLTVMDQTAYTICEENNIPLMVYDAGQLETNTIRILHGEHIGTLVTA